jgi:diguanylate cyclase (GGDEF)-like protein
LSTVHAAAAQAVAKHEHDGEFALAVDAVVAAAAAQDEARRALHRRATVDDLTGLPNRSGLVTLINQALERVRRDGTALAVAFCDIDRLRVINDVYGHAVGDEVLEIVAERLTRATTPPEFVGRFGGDVFVIVAPASDDSFDTAAFGQRLAGVFQRPVATSQSDTDITASIGMATVTAGTVGDADAETLLRDADTALNDAKARGGTAIGTFDATLRSTVVYRADLERRLSSAVARGQITVHFQPIVMLDSRMVIGFEALARWNDDGTMMLPGEWIPVAEATGLINDIGEEVLRQAVAQLRAWSADGHSVGVSVNVSARQLANRRFYDAVRGLVGDGVAASALTLEVTESLAIDDQAIELLMDLRRQGLRIALDDFGTGFSALAAVSRLPVDCLKIDQSIVSRVDALDGQAITGAAIGIARALHLTTVAEGIETVDAETALIGLGCTQGQGYLYGRPTDAASATRLLVEQRRAAAQPSGAQQPAVSRR